MSDKQDNAFAHVITIGNGTHKLCRHHNLDMVKDGLEHDTLDVGALKMSLITVEVAPFRSEDERDIARAHLESHAKALGFIKIESTWIETDEEAERMVNQQAGSPPGDPTLVDNKQDQSFFPEIAPKTNRDGEPDPGDGLKIDHVDIIKNKDQLSISSIVMTSDNAFGIVENIITDSKNNHIAVLIKKSSQSTEKYLIEDITVLTRKSSGGKFPLDIKAFNNAEAMQSVINNSVDDLDQTLVCSSDFTQDGLDYIKRRVMSCVNNQVKAKVLSVDKHGSVEFLSVKFGEENQEFPFQLHVELSKDEKGKVKAISIMNFQIPADVFDDTAEYLKSLTK